MAALEVWRGVLFDGVLPLNGKITVGREGCGADFQVDDARMSKRHCKFSVDADGNATVVDSSTNGVFVNGHPIPKGVRTLLKHGDVVSPVIILHKHPANVSNPEQQNLMTLVVFVVSDGRPSGTRPITTTAPTISVAQPPNKAEQSAHALPQQNASMKLPRSTIDALPQPPSMAASQSAVQPVQSPMAQLAPRFMPHPALHPAPQPAPQSAPLQPALQRHSPQPAQQRTPHLGLVSALQPHRTPHPALQSALQPPLQPVTNPGSPARMERMPQPHASSHASMLFHPFAPRPAVQSAQFESTPFAPVPRHSSPPAAMGLLNLPSNAAASATSSHCLQTHWPAACEQPKIAAAAPGTPHRLHIPPSDMRTVEHQTVSPRPRCERSSTSALGDLLRYAPPRLPNAGQWLDECRRYDRWETAESLMTKPVRAEGFDSLPPATGPCAQLPRHEQTSCPGAFAAGGHPNAAPADRAPCTSDMDVFEFCDEPPPPMIRARSDRSVVKTASMFQGIRTTGTTRKRVRNACDETVAAASEVKRKPVQDACDETVAAASEASVRTDVASVPEGKPAGSPAKPHNTDTSDTEEPLAASGGQGDPLDEPLDGEVAVVRRCSSSASKLSSPSEKARQCGTPGCKKPDFHVGLCSRDEELAAELASPAGNATGAGCRPSRARGTLLRPRSRLSRPPATEGGTEGGTEGTWAETASKLTPKWPASRPRSVGLADAHAHAQGANHRDDAAVTDTTLLDTLRYLRATST